MSQHPSEQDISREAIKAVYAAGEAAVIELVERLREQHLSVVEKLTAQQQSLEARLSALENKQKKTSRNSSKPPSGDGFGRRTKSLRNTTLFMR